VGERPLRLLPAVHAELAASLAVFAVWTFTYSRCLAKALFYCRADRDGPAHSVLARPAERNEDAPSFAHRFEVDVRGRTGPVKPAKVRLNASFEPFRG
jgi:hypothetical protein